MDVRSACTAQRLDWPDTAPQWERSACWEMGFCICPPFLSLSLSLTKGLIHQVLLFTRRLEEFSFVHC